MRKTPYYIYRLFVPVVTGCLLLCGSCDVHEFPSADDEPATHEVTLHLNFHTDLPQYRVVEYTRTRAASTDPDDYDLRYLIHIYKDDGTGTFDNGEYTSRIETKDDVTALNHDLKLQLEEGNYRFVVWTDYVDNGTEEDKFYDTGRFEEITLRGDEHAGNCHFRDAFRGLEEVTIADGSTREATVEMERPMARYSFVTTDLDLFLTRVMEQQAASKETAETTDAPTKAIDLNDYRVTFRYTGYMPSAFNALTDKPVDAQTGVSFDGQITRLSDNEAELGFDYVFVNGTESTVQVMLEVRNNEGDVIASISPVDVPLMRSRHTTVRGPFLTTEATGGVGISPGFDGEWNYEIR